MDATPDRPVDPESDDVDDDARPVDRRRHTAAHGVAAHGVAAHGVAAHGVAAAFALGLQQVFDPQPVDTVGIEQEAPTRPVDPDKLELRFDPMSSSNTVVVVRRPDDD